MSKAYELIRENGKIVDIKINGKSAKKSYINAVIKAQNTSYWCEYKESGVVENPFGGSIKLNPLERTIAKWCQNWYYNDYSRNPYNPQVKVSTYDSMKYFLLDLNSKAYMELLDQFHLVCV